VHRALLSTWSGTSHTHRAGRSFDLAPDGQFLMVKLSGQRRADAPPPVINVVLNRFEEFTARVPVP
jgi:hypothetical protein